MKRTVKEYMKLPYTIEITPDDGSFFVKVRELEGCISVGETKAEALEMIEDAMREWLAVALEDNLEIPLPEAMQEERFSGRFPLRMPKSLHRKLAEAAEKEGTSLNQFIVVLLSERHALHKVKKILAEKLGQPAFKEPEVETTISVTGESRKVLPFPQWKVKVVGN